MKIARSAYLSDWYYKRTHLLFSDLGRLSKILNNPDKPVQFIFAGKAHPADKAGQDLIKLIVDVSFKSENTRF